MLIRNFNLSNHFICYKNISFDFSKCGIYFFVGKNGTGKTSIIENIVFGNNTVSFDSDDEQYLYEKERYKLFSYVPQKIDESDQSVWDFLCKDNPDVNNEMLTDYFSAFNLVNISYRERYSKLSGGEKVKLAIISAIIKNTKYIFLDEPTNYLDDKSVEQLKSILERLSEDRVVIVASHDNRLMDLDGTRIKLSGNSAEISGEAKGVVSKSLYHSPDKNKSAANSLFSRIALLKINKPINYLILVLLLVLSCYLSVYIQNKYYDEYVVADPPEAGIVLVYDSDHGYGELNQLYCAHNGIEIDEQKYGDLIFLDDIPKIAETRDVDQIFIHDYERHYEYCLFQLKLSDESISEQIIIEYLALPEFMQNDEIFFSHMCFWDIQFMTVGRLPKDGADEVALSRNILKKCFGIEYDNDDAALGQAIEIDGKTYTIVGVMTADFCLVSYSEDLSECGIYIYSEDTFGDFKQRYEDFLNDNNFNYHNVEDLIIKTKSSNDKKLLDTLIVQFPGNNYYSRSWTISVSNEINETFVPSIVWFVVPVSLILGIVALLLQANQISLNIARLQSYMRYYFTKSILYHFIVQTICGYLLVFICTFIFNFWYNTITKVFANMAWLAVLSFVLIILPSCVYTTIKLLNVHYYQPCREK